MTVSQRPQCTSGDLCFLCLCTCPVGTRPAARALGALCTECTRLPCPPAPLPPRPRCAHARQTSRFNSHRLGHETQGLAQGFGAETVRAPHAGAPVAHLPCPALLSLILSPPEGPCFGRAAHWHQRRATITRLTRAEAAMDTREASGLTDAADAGWKAPGRRRREALCPSPCTQPEAGHPRPRSQDVPIRPSPGPRRQAGPRPPAPHPSQSCQAQGIGSVSIPCLQHGAPRPQHNWRGGLTAPPQSLHWSHVRVDLPGAHSPAQPRPESCPQIHSPPQAWVPGTHTGYLFGARTFQTFPPAWALPVTLDVQGGGRCALLKRGRNTDLPLSHCFSCWNHS